MTTPAPLIISAATNPPPNGELYAGHITGRAITSPRATWHQSRITKPAVSVCFSGMLRPRLIFYDFTRYNLFGEVINVAHGIICSNVSSNPSARLGSATS